jgi:hydrogenase/urease accessory protein HupE
MAKPATAVVVWSIVGAVLLLNGLLVALAADPDSSIAVIVIAFGLLIAMLGLLRAMVLHRRPSP